MGEIAIPFIFKLEKSRLPGSNSRPNVSEGYMITSELQGRPALRVRNFYRDKESYSAGRPGGSVGNLATF